MAFIIYPVSASASKSDHASNTSCCKQRRITNPLQAVGAAVIISASLLTSNVALSEDAPLVFDHDQSLSGANFSNRQDLKGAIFSKSNCKQATFAGSDLTNAQLDDANVRFLFNNQSFTICTGRKSLGIALTYFYFRFFHLPQFQEANFEGVTAINSTATKAKFQKANLKDAGSLVSYY